MDKSTTPYTIIRREHTKKCGDRGYLGFEHKNMGVPLVGCNEYSGDIDIGDVVGVKLKSSVRTKVEFVPDLDELETNSVGIHYDTHFGSYEQIEEHLFIVTKKIKKTLFAVQPIFLDTDKVIVKEIDESFDGTIFQKISSSNEYEVCEKFYEKV